MKIVICTLLLLGLSACAVPYPVGRTYPAYEEPYPGYFGGYAYDYYPYTYYYGAFGAYPYYWDHHRYYNWGHWHGGFHGGGFHGGGFHGGGHH